MIRFLQRALFQRIFFSLGFGFFFALALKTAPFLIKAQKSFEYVRMTCTIEKIDWVEGSESRKLLLSYSYNFDGKSYQGHTYMWGLDLFDQQNRKGAGAFSNRVVSGSNHGCFIDPNNPSDSVINPGFAFETYEVWVIIILLLFLAWGFITAWFFPKTAEEIFTSADPS